MVTPNNTKAYTALNGALVFVMLTYRNLLTNALVSDLEKIKSYDEWHYTMHAFCILVGATAGIECLDTENPEASAIVEFWEESQDKPTLERWDLFQKLLSEDALNAWWEAYQNTRQNVAPAPRILAEGEPNDPN